MHVDSDRFSLTDTEQARVKAFRDEIWYNAEVCNHCFSRVRAIERNPAAERLAPSSLKNIPAEVYERTELGTQEHCGWDHNRRFGTCFCLNCGGDLSADHHQLPRAKMKQFAKNIARYVEGHTSLSLDRQRFFAELLRQKNRRDTQGKEGQIFAVAFARALQTRTGSSTTPLTQHAD